MRRRNIIRLALITAFFALFFVNAEAQQKKYGNIYELQSMTNPNAQLARDAVIFSFPVDKAEIIDDHNGWCIFSTEEVEIRRRIISGHFVYVDKRDLPLVEYEKNKEPVAQDQIYDRAMNLFQQLGVSSQEVDRVWVKRIVDQDENESGDDVGTLKTTAYLVYAHRSIDGVPVVGSMAKAMFFPDGRLLKLTLRWRAINPTPLENRELHSENQLKQVARQEAAASRVLNDEPPVLYGGYAYVESHDYPVVQNRFIPMYFYRYSGGGSPLMDSYIDATK